MAPGSSTSGVLHVCFHVSTLIQPHFTSSTFPPTPASENHLSFFLFFFFLRSSKQEGCRSMCRRPEQARPTLVNSGGSRALCNFSYFRACFFLLQVGWGSEKKLRRPPMLCVHLEHGKRQKRRKEEGLSDRRQDWRSVRFQSTS